MIVVRGIVVGPKHDVEIAAGTLVHRAQEARFDSRPLPVGATPICRPPASVKPLMSSALALACSLRMSFQSGLPTMLRQA